MSHTPLMNVLLCHLYSKVGDLEIIIISPHLSFELPSCHLSCCNGIISGSQCLEYFYFIFTFFIFFPPDYSWFLFPLKYYPERKWKVGCTIGDAAQKDQETDGKLKHERVKQAICFSHSRRSMCLFMVHQHKEVAIVIA